MLDSLLAALKSLNETGFTGTVDCIPQPYLREGIDIAISKYDLPSVLVPPEIIEVEGITSETGSETQIKKEEWPEYYFRVFTDEVGFQTCFDFQLSVYHLSLGVARPKHACRLYYSQCSN